jgi:tRNA pseudouridine38-40 synthase
MARFRLLIEYEGSAYAGWQIQKNDPTVQGEIERALATVLRENITVTGAGRTDAGVHARGQVAHFDTENAFDADQLHRSLNGILNEDIRIKSVEPAASDFHARYSARSRIYHYVIARQPVALSRHTCWYLSANLDVSSLNAASGKLIGSHDFKSFCRSISDVPHHTCTVLRANWNETGEGFLMFVIEADRFLHGMVRALVGTLIEIGRGRLTPEDICHILDKKDRTAAGEAAPARGLILHRVVY